MCQDLRSEGGRGFDPEGRTIASAPAGREAVVVAEIDRAVVEATRKPEDVEHWVDGLARVDALIVQDTDLSADPAAVLQSLAAPVAVVDGVRATPHRWASVLCERLESAPA